MATARPGPAAPGGKTTYPVPLSLDDANRRIGKLSMEVELLRIKAARARLRQRRVLPASGSRARNSHPRTPRPAPGER